MLRPVLVLLAVFEVHSEMLPFLSFPILGRIPPQTHLFLRSLVGLPPLGLQAYPDRVDVIYVR